MTAAGAIAEIERSRLLVIVRLSHPGDDVARALVDGGVRVVEISLTSGGAVDVIARWRERIEGLVIGAGTVLTEADAVRAIEAGAAFLISPGWHADVDSCAREAGLPYIPGALTPTEVYACQSSGAPLVKLFPASRLGSAYVRDLRGPFPAVPLMPTGGVSEANALDFLDAGAVAVAVGSSVVADAMKPAAIAAAAARLANLISSQQGAD